MCDYCSGLARGEVMGRNAVLDNRICPDENVIVGIGCETDEDGRVRHPLLMVTDWATGYVLFASEIGYCPKCGRRL